MAVIKKKVLKAKPKPKKKPVATVKKKPVKKIIAKKTAPKKIVVKKKPIIKKVAPKVVPVAKKTEVKIGEVTHYYAQIGVAVVQIAQKTLRVGDTIHIKGHTTDFTQSVESMEVEFQQVTQATVGELFGMKVEQHVRVGDLVYR